MYLHILVMHISHPDNAEPTQQNTPDDDNDLEMDSSGVATIEALEASASYKNTCLSIH